MQMQGIRAAVGWPVSSFWFGTQLLTGKTYDVLTLAPVSANVWSISIKLIELTNSPVMYHV